MRSARRAPSMPRAVLDSSVLLSTLLTRHGSVVRLLREPIRGHYELCLLEAILAETAETLFTNRGSGATPIKT
jgi:predicted nucleic acid-binding protein